jgi:hypothetical protein
MSQEKHPVKIWRGTRKSFDALEATDPWKRYSVKEENGSWTEYYGSEMITRDIDCGTY